MFDSLASLWANVFSGATPALPDPAVMRLYLLLAWAVVLGGLACAWSPARYRAGALVLAVGLALWVLVPGTLSPDHWLGLAFQAPSLTTVALCGALLWRLRPGRLAPATGKAGWALVLLGIALGYVLLLDTFAVWPWQVYSLGFSPGALLCVMALALGISVWGTGVGWLWRGLLPGVMLAYAATRLPTGNAWDALLDPLLWLVLHGLVLRALYRRVRRPNQTL